MVERGSAPWEVWKEDRQEFAGDTLDARELAPIEASMTAVGK